MGFSRIATPVFPVSLFVFVISAGLNCVQADERPAIARKPLFAFGFDHHDLRKRDFDQQAQMLKQLKFSGMGHVGLIDLNQRLKALDRVGLKLCLAGERVDLTHASSSYLPQLQAAFETLKGRDTIIYLVLTGQPVNDQAVVPALRQIAAQAAKCKLRVAIYPHTGEWVRRSDHAVRLARKVDRPNCGVAFNLCHWLKNENPSGLVPLLKSAMPYLMLVTINGADVAGKDDQNWARLIQPLDQGTFDVGMLLNTLRRLGYQGQIGLMCWGIGGDAQTHLQRSMAAWHNLPVANRQ